VNSGRPIAVAFVVAPAPERADVALTASGPATAQSGARVEYMLTVRNNGPDTARQVVVTAPIPAGTSFVGSTGGSHAGGVLTWNAGTVNRNATKSATVTLDIGGGTTGSLVFGASAATGTSDPTPANNSAQVTTSVSAAPRADLVVGLTAPATGAAGQDMTLQVTVQNLGPASAASVVLRATLPSGVSFRSASGGGSHSNGVVTWALGTLTAGSAARSFQLVVRPGSNTAGNVTHGLTASSTTLDPNPDNGSATATTLVLGSNQADVSVTIDGPASAAPGAVVRYDITVTNHGPAKANQVDLRFAIPSQTSFVLATRGQVSEGALTWSHSSISSGSSFATSVYLRVASNASGSITNTVVATTSTTDPYQVNNTGTRTTSVD
jgi:uncharacterized repeat protein (TIGR01451 family)